MQTIRHAHERGYARFDWLESRHTFSFGQYYDPQFMGFGPLRVINEDQVAPGAGFATHGHRDMEIISIVLSGAMQHADNLGNGSIIRPGDVQRMTAGTGVRHSEYNNSDQEPLHFLQIWIMPERSGLAPGYEQQSFDPNAQINQFVLVGSQDGRNGSVTIHQDVDLYISHLRNGASVAHPLASGRIAWLQVVTGSVLVNNCLLQAGDGMAIQLADQVRLSTADSAQVMLFDMAQLND